MRLRYGRRLRNRRSRKTECKTIVNPMVNNLENIKKNGNNVPKPTRRFFSSIPAYGDKDDQRCGTYMTGFAIVMCIVMLV